MSNDELILDTDTSEHSKKNAVTGKDPLDVLNLANTMISHPPIFHQPSIKSRDNMLQASASSLPSQFFTLNGGQLDELVWRNLWKKSLRTRLPPVVNQLCPPGFGLSQLFFWLRPIWKTLAKSVQSYWLLGAYLVEPIPVTPRMEGEKLLDHTIWSSTIPKVKHRFTLKLMSFQVPNLLFQNTILVSMFIFVRILLFFSNLHPPQNLT